MGFLDKFRPMLDKAKAKAQDPQFQAKVKAAAEKQAEKRRPAATTRPTGGHQSGRRAFTGGAPGTPGYPWYPGDPLYGQYAHPGFYGDDGTWYEQDSDGDGVPDSQDAAPNDPTIQTPEQADQAQYGDTDADGVPDAQDSDNQYGGEPDEPGGEAYEGYDGTSPDVPDAAGDVYEGGGGVDPGYSESSPTDTGGYSDSGGGDSGGGGGE